MFGGKNILIVVFQVGQTSIIQKTQQTQKK